MASDTRAETYFSAYRADAVRLAYLLTRDREAAEDIAQDAFIRVFRRLGDLRKPQSFVAYLRRTVVNLAKDHHRKAGRERNAVEAIGRLESRDEVVDPAAEASRAEDVGYLARLPFHAADRKDPHSAHSCDVRVPLRREDGRSSPSDDDPPRMVSLRTLAYGFGVLPPVASVVPSGGGPGEREKIMRFRTRLVATAAVGSMAIAALSGPAAAHKREFMWVYAASTSDSEIKAQAELSTGKHAGTLRMTLKKKVDGEWELVASKVAKHGEDGYYTAMFSTLGDENCKVFAKHTAKDHPTIKKASNSFDC